MMDVFIAPGSAVACGAGLQLARKAAVRKVSELKNALSAGLPAYAASVDFTALQNLPPPVLRYFRKVLVDGQPMIRFAELRQRGTLRTNPQADKWLEFSATESVAPLRPGFIWDARIALPLGCHLRVVDAYVDGAGSGRVSLLSALPLASETNTPELNSGALHRYLAEAVWFPTALLPQAGIQWTYIDERSALATLADGNTSVALVFHFNDDDEVSHVEADARWGRFKEGYRQARWEGHFSDYRSEHGMWVPGYGEVGWYCGDVLQLVWKGRISAFHFH